ncbi:uncharacterized protein A4U43_C04F32780 [Asparagus officinalis]|uniref:Uncharacterized protein n=1 Tax=Asparagus officinalis TaxID=4686 RepID=A0A5P1F9W2_ASPOF|nr:uncharacterized protein A4U43_C04F32780 [Asparagus officinalis]
MNKSNGSGENVYKPDVNHVEVSGVFSGARAQDDFVKAGEFSVGNIKSGSADMLYSDTLVQSVISGAHTLRVATLGFGARPDTVKIEGRGARARCISGAVELDWWAGDENQAGKELVGAWGEAGVLVVG